MTTSDAVHRVAWGATPSDWSLLDLELGLTADLLPVVSRPDAKISPRSSLKGLGKTPSRYLKGEVVGFVDWTQHQTSTEEVTRWSGQPDYGICLQTREVRALDVDVTDPELAERIFEALPAGLPLRSRSNSSKFLAAFRLPGDYPKRRLKVGDGQYIEFLGTGQQFVAHGTHPSGVRYEWTWPDEVDFPVVSPEAFEALWRELESLFGVEDAVEARLSTRKEALTAAVSSDPVAQFLFDTGQVLDTRPDGRIFIECPWAEEHTEGVGDQSSTVYYPAHTGGYERGHFNCKHASHADKKDGDFLQAIGYRDKEVHDDFRALPELAPPPSVDAAPLRYHPYWPDALRGRPMQGYHIKGVVPECCTVVMYGASASGKSFAAIDMAAAIALGQSWNGHRVHQANVLYVAAEDSLGVVHRVHAYEDHFGVKLKVALVGATPHLVEPGEVEDLAAAAVFVNAKVVIIDTLARVTAGLNENSGEDMGEFLNRVQSLHRLAGATVILVHHSGKDQAKGARGWSGIRAAVDAELEVIRDAETGFRELRVTKQKNAVDGAVYGFELVPVVLGKDADGDDITSCWCKWGAPSGSRRRDKYKPSGVMEKAILTALSIIEMSQTAGIEVGGVLEMALAELGPWEGEGRDSRRSNLRRAMNGLAKKGLFILKDDCIELGTVAEEDENAR